MSANVETMFRARVTPWHGLGTVVESALSSEEALEQSGLDWIVSQRPIMTDSYDPIPGWKANIRDIDDKVLGVVTDRYKVVQNHEAFEFTDALLGEGVRYETAGRAKHPPPAILNMTPQQSRPMLPKKNLPKMLHRLNLFKLHPLK